MTRFDSPLPPIKRAVSVSWNPETAFRRFTEGFGTWWPTATHSIGGDRVRSVTFDCRVGGLIVEELTDGRRFQWGRITAWDPPRRVAFVWHPSREEPDAQDAEPEVALAGTLSRSSFGVDGSSGRDAILATTSAWTPTAPFPIS